nr:hypothetical protein [Tanacetum cinerariifolium]
MPHHSPSLDYVSGPEHLPSLDYVPGPEEPEQALLSPDYVPEPEYPKYLVPYKAEAPIEDQPLSDDVSPTALSLGYVADLDPKEDPYKDPKEDLVDCPAFEDDDKEKKEHPALANSSVVHVDDPGPSVEDTETFKSDESAPTPVPSPRRHTARIFIPSPPLPLPLPPTTSPTYAKAPLRNRADEIRLRVASPSTHHPLEIPSLPMLLPSTSHRDDTPEADMPLWKRAHFTALAFGFEVEESLAAAVARQSVLDVANMDATPRRLLSREVSYGIKNVWCDMVGDMEEKAPTTGEGLSQRVTDLSTTLARDTHKIYVRQASIGTCHGLHRAIHFELQAYRAQVQIHNTRIQTQNARIGSLVTLVATMVAHTSSLHTQLTTALGRIQTLEAREPARIDDLEDAEHEANISRNNDDNHDSGSDRRRRMPVARECTYTDFVKCQLLIFKGTKGVVGLTQSFEKMESFFNISKCTVACQIKFHTCNLQGNALTWWNSHIRTVGHDVAYAMT